MSEYMLGETECDSELAYYLKYGVYPKIEHSCEQTDKPTIYDKEYEDEKYINFIEANNIY